MRLQLVWNEKESFPCTGVKISQLGGEKGGCQFKQWGTGGNLSKEKGISKATGAGIARQKDLLVRKLRQEWGLEPVRWANKGLFEEKLFNDSA